MSARRSKATTAGGAEGEYKATGSGAGDLERTDNRETGEEGEENIHVNIRHSPSNSRKKCIQF